MLCEYSSLHVFGKCQRHKQSRTRGEGSYCGVMGLMFLVTLLSYFRICNS